MACLIFWVEPDWRPEWDSAMYLLTARALALGEGYTYLGDPFFLRPPGMAWLLSLVMENGVFQAEAVNRLVMGSAILAGFAVFFGLRSLHSRGAAVVLTALTVTSPGFVALFNRVMSEFPYLALTFVGIGLFERSKGPRPGARWLAIVAAFCLAGALALRSIGLLLIPGMLLSRSQATESTHGQLLRRGVAPVLLIALSLPWFLHAQQAEQQAEAPSHQMLNFSYTTSMFHVDPRNPESPWISVNHFVDRLQDNGQALFHDLGWCVFRSKHGAVGMALALLVAVGFGICWRRGATLFEWLTVFYTALLLTYFTNAFRLFLPLVPLAYRYLWVAVSTGLDKLTSGSIPAPRLALLAVPLFVGNLVFFQDSLAGDFPLVRGTRTIALWQKPPLVQDLQAVSQWIEENTPEDAVLLASSAPMYSALTGRKVFTYRFAEGDRLPALLEEWQPQYVIFDGQSPKLQSLVTPVVQRSFQNWVLTPRPDRAPIAIYRLVPWQ